MMGLRTDITLQIARISCGGLKTSPRPLRVCYSGEILKVKNNNLDMSRQFSQIGAEIIGIGDSFCEIELINLLLEILENLKIKNFIINFNMPILIRAIQEDFGLSMTDQNLLKEKYKNKNINGLDKISKELFNTSKILKSCIGDLDENIVALKKYNFNKNTKNIIDVFINTVTKIKSEFPKIRILIDPLEVDGSNYHSGISFKVYSEKFKELFSGGNYKVNNENCIGFSGFLENLIHDARIISNSRHKIFIPYDTEVKEKKNLIKSGFIVVRAVQKLTKEQLQKEAKNQKCRFFFYNKEKLNVV